MNVLKKEIERRGPIYLGLFLAVMAIVFAPALFARSIQDHWQIESLYSSAFDVSSIAAAFLFAFFTFARTTEGEFFSALRKTKAFREFLGYLVVSIVATAFLTVLSIPFMIVDPKPTAAWTLEHVMVIIWAFVVGFSTGATVRATRQFISFAMADPSV